MIFGLDYVTGPPIADLKKAGVTFVCRYLSEVNELTKVKLLSAGEAKTLAQAGISVVSNYEWYGNRASEGFNSGVTDAQIAQSQHAAAGGPTDRPIYFSVDFNTGATAAIIEYFKGVASVIGLHRTGAYGGYACIKGLLDAGVITWAWQTYAWSGGAWEPRAHIRQYSNGETIAGLSVDFDQAMKSDFGQWLVGESMQQYSENSADFKTWFTRVDADHWKCIRTGKVIQFGIRGFYAGLSLDGNTLPIVGLPTSDEIYLTVNGKSVVLQTFERAGIYYDQAHTKDSQPGTGAYALCHLNDPDFIAHVPGLPTQTPAPITMPNIADAIAHIEAAQAAAGVVTTELGKALPDLKQ